MKIVVAVKHVPDTEARIKVGAGGSSIEEAGLKWIASPYDEYAVEEALQLRDAAGSGEVVVIGAGPGEAAATLRQALAMGADRAVLVEDSRFFYADGLARSEALAAVARAEAPDLVLMGKQGVGPDESQTAPMVAELLGLPHVTAVTKLEIAERRFSARREIEGAVEVHEGRLPAVLSIDKGINEPRYASLKGIMAAKKKPLETKTLADVGLTPDRLTTGALLRWEAIELPAPRGEGKRLEGDVDQQVRELVRALHEVEKLI